MSDELEAKAAADLADDKNIYGQWTVRIDGGRLQVICLTRGAGVAFVYDAFIPVLGLSANLHLASLAVKSYSEQKKQEAHEYSKRKG